MKHGNNLLLTTSPSAQKYNYLRKPTSYHSHRKIAVKPCKRNEALWIDWKDSSNSADVTPFRFTGKERDEETGLYYYGARYLDPKTSRWMSTDPAMGEYLPSAPINDEAKKRNGNLPGQGGIFNYVNMHVYHYAGNNPVKYVDPDGRDGETPITGVDINLHNSEFEQKAINDSKNIYRPENSFIIAGHGYPENMLDWRDLLPISLSPEDLVEMIISHCNYKKGKEIILIACNTGKTPESGGDSFAQKVADLLGPGTIVRAPDNFTTTDSEGNIYIGPEIADGLMFLLDPNVKLSSKTSGGMLIFTGRNKED